MVADGDGRLEQCGDGQFLEAVRFRCPHCPEPVTTTVAVPGAVLRVDSHGGES
jgi:hypothetical protein